MQLHFYSVMCPQELLDISCKKIFELALVKWNYSQISRNLSSVLCSNVICGMCKAAVQWILPFEQGAVYLKNMSRLDLKIFTFFAKNNSVSWCVQLAFKGGWIWNCTSFENLTQARSLFHTLEVTSCVRDTKASSEYILKAHPYIQHFCKFQQLWNNINNNNDSVQLFIKLLFHHLEHLDSLG